MNKIFSCLMKGRKKVSKYVIFSLSFIMVCLLGVSVRVEAGVELTNYSPNTNISGITSINGELSDQCIAPPNSDNLAYSILKSSHKGNNGKSEEKKAQCISYTKTDGTAYYYIQATDATGSFNQITFTITSTQSYNYISIFEPGFTMSSTSDTYDYDLFTRTSTSPLEYTYQRITDTAKDTSQNGTISFDTTSGVIYTFTYTLRDSSYGAHNIEVRLYDAKYDHPNPTHEVQLSYILAKPINEYSEAIYKNVTDSCDLTGSALCIIYDDDNKSSSGTDVTNYFTIKFSNKAAFYFSTVNTHEVTPTATSVEQYNSIYAENTFSNIGQNDSLVYHYFNLKDNSTYDYALTTKADNYYNFTLTIDASGNYAFFLTDIFGNTKSISHATDLEITDISNRDLTIYYLSYKNDLNAGEANADNVDSYSESLEAFMLKNDMTKITSNNVTIGLEFYFQVKINDDYAVSAGPDGQIKKNPLYYTAADYQISMGTNLAPNTYYCRQADGTSEGVCVGTVSDPNKNASHFLKQMLSGTAQQIAANTTTGLKAVTNNFTFVDGLVDTKEGSNTFAVTDKTNRVNIQVNENGRFYVNVQDVYENVKHSTIDVSILDQMKPVITVTADNKICSSMYVIGAGGVIQGYPTAQVTDCASQTVTYDKFIPVDTTQTTEKQDPIRVLFQYKRNGTLGSNESNTNGFYNTGTTSVSFSYADAIRIGLLRASDSMDVYNVNGLVEKSKYEKTEDTYTAYSIYTLKDTYSTSGTFALPASDAYGNLSTGRVNYKNDKIITDNYLQYSSELEPYDASGTQFVMYVIYLIDENGNATGDAICDSVNNGTDCENIVNAYIDKGISFQMQFSAKDYAGNVSNIVSVNVDVVDDTTPGIAKTDSDSKIETDPIIAINNIDTECRLEIGINLQSKLKLLECYGLIDDSTAATPKYNFVDNATTYEVLATSTYSTNKYYTNILYQQLYGVNSRASYADSITIYICNKIGNGACTEGNVAGAAWQEVNGTAISFVKAGSYEIKFEIKDTGTDYSNSDGANSTVLVLCYYVNPRVLLVRPIEQTKTYGEANSTIDYCVYATTNTSAIYYNLFNITAGGDYKDTADFVNKNYESNMGIVYCTTTDTVDIGGATKKDSENDILLNSSAHITGALARTYATDNKAGSTNYKYNLELLDNAGQATVYNAYEDAGYYYITMGNLKITDEYKEDYVLRLHPTYLLDGQTPNVALKNYHDLTDDAYKYGINTVSHGETISNVLYTIKQAPLNVKANNGSKVYGHVDTNYSQAFEDDATVNISLLNGTSKSVAGYLNGYSVSGFINTGTNNTLKDIDVVTDHYSQIIQGTLRREAGERVGNYSICNVNDAINNNWTHGCNSETIAIRQVTSQVTLTTSNVFRTSGGSTITNVNEIAYGLYVNIGGNYYKLTRYNTTYDATSSTWTFSDKLSAKLWQYDYDDSNYAVVILPNKNNDNQNYYIIYEAATYTITPRTLIVQPGANQGKEYSNPAHNDPMFEIVVYGEPTTSDASYSIKYVGDASGFNGYTKNVEALTHPTQTPYDQLPYSNEDGGKAKDTSLYYSDRRTRTTEITGAVYTYKFDEITLTGNEFTLDGVVFGYDSATDKIYAKLNPIAETYANGADIGGYKVTISGGKAIITLNGVLTYQNYVLFESSSNGAGSGKISRVAGEIVGWYDYSWNATDLHAYPATGAKAHCNRDANYKYTLDGSDLCADFEIEFTVNAPGKSGSEYTTTETLAAVHDGYLHNGANYCNDTTIYSYGCGTGVKTIKFSIFKRDIILSFNYEEETYGNVYSYFADGIFKIEDSTTVPTVITCYKKDTSATSNYVVGKNGIRYTAISYDDCGGVDYGLSASDKWGSSGLNLRFFLNSVISSKFSVDYPIPAGLYFVDATIGTDDGSGKYVHQNYNLVYIDYDILVKGTGSDASPEKPTQKNGALEITPKAVNLVGTYYQKEYGQAIYATYATATEALTDNGNYIYNTLTAAFSNNKIINIFDNHYYYCDASSAVESALLPHGISDLKYGCAIKHDGTDTKYIFDSKGNVYLYTVEGMLNLSAGGGKVDEIYVNFAGTPVRTRRNVVSGDLYGLLDDVGYYDISLAGITPVVAQYSDVTFSKELGTIYRNTNYSISSTSAGRLYITPAQIQIEVVSGQTKMYGCAYNTFNTSITSTYVYESGYSNCVEGAAQYYDLGYKYIVKNDKTNYLKEVVSGTARYASFNGGATPTCDDWETGGCADISYDVSYEVIPNYNTPSDGKPEFTALNSGTMFRIKTTANTGNVTYNYQEYYNYGVNSQLAINDSNIKFQDQNVGYYAITLGNLDAEFNNENLCNVYSLPTDGGDRKCKNFIVNYGGNNTSTHTKDGTVDKFESAEFKVNIANHLFTIEQRKVIVTTEYNYKVYGDTDPNEGYTCLDLKNMFKYSAGFGTTFSYDGRSTYCSGDDTFIPTGVARFYVVDNSLAKAPWTGWVDNAGNYDSYNDALYDVLSTSSVIKRKGENNGTSPLQGDAVGKYAYEYALSLNETLNGKNYVINYLNAASGGTPVAEENVVVGTIGTSPEINTVVGFATTREDAGVFVGLDRWYDDLNHKCIIATNGTACDNYDGDDVYNFKVDGIEFNSENSYKTSKTVDGTTTTIVSELYGGVYFEIVRREIFIKTESVTKDYGIEDNYNMFNVTICSDYDSTNKTCTEIDPDDAKVWGVRNSLSWADYAAFYPSGTFSQSAFKGSAEDSTYRGDTKATSATYEKAFGIYFYRTAGETKNDYVIVACATQSLNDTACRTYYNNLSTEAARLADVKSFTSTTSTNDYNASNYIVKTIPSQIKIIQRRVHITPDEGQGFMYGNYETGKVLPPITYKEYYVSGAYGDGVHADAGSKGTSSGLVNGSLSSAGGSDTVNNQLALCIFDISERLTCINDRQNSSGGSVVGYVATGLHGDATLTDEFVTGYGQISYLGFNVYNDTYTEDRTTDRFALNRSLSVAGGYSDTDARYNRNVGTYTITAGELYSSDAAWDPWCGDGTTTNCLNINYKIVGFDEGETYEITPATVIATPRSDQNKTYGQADVHLTFDVKTMFELDAPNDDKYYCAGNKCQSDTSPSSSDFASYNGYDSTNKIVTLNNFAYNENDNDTSNYNYGQSRVADKYTTSGYKDITSTFGSDNADNPKYYDKFCKDYAEGDCWPYVGSSHEYASLKYADTNRILLGYFYVTGYYQKAGTHMIKSGISVAKNEFGVQNYLYKTGYGVASEISMGADTGVEFTIEKLDLIATIKDVTKVYGQATDAYKCDAAAGCNTDFAALSANNNENRLEFNFDIDDTTADANDIVNMIAGDPRVILTKAINSKYYTQTGGAEYKNVHLGLSVVRAINNGTTCIQTNDKFGCEDVGEYTLVLRKQDVPNDVDVNYNVMYVQSGGTNVGLSFTDSTGYAIVNSIADPIAISEPNSDATSRSEATKYITYTDSGIDGIPGAQNSAPTSNSVSIKVSSYSAKLTIIKRSVVFYIGTYNDDGSVAQRYVIEQNEQVPELPGLNKPFTNSTTNPKQKQVYYVTWFDYKEYPSGLVFGEATSKTLVPRQVRTADELTSTQDSYGVGLCKVNSDNIQSEVYGKRNCSVDNFVVNADANKNTGGTYVFNTANIGNYAIVRNKEVTYISTKANEDKNYDVLDHNGTLVIFEDQTAPEIQIGNSEFVIEANAHTVGADCATNVRNDAQNTFYYNCSVQGKLFDEVSKVNNKIDILGQIIAYLTKNFSGYDSAANLGSQWTSINKSTYKLPDNLSSVDYSTWTYLPVNNIGIKASNKNTTLYDVYRYENTYDFDTAYISTKLNAISSIISWFNINSFDYSYIRNNNYTTTKRYTPRYYIYINGNDELSAFDPTYVGDFKITIYAVDDVGNQSHKDVTLKIVDTTTPVVSKTYVFNAPVECDATGSCVKNTIDEWYVKSGFVSIDSFVKYKDTAGTVDDVNGTYIRLNGSMVNIYSGSIRYRFDGTNYVKDILGRYVQVGTKTTKALEVEHRYWSNSPTKYLVIIGGEDNSYINPAQNDTEAANPSQWDSYYTIDGTKWYMYNRHDLDGVTINFAEGSTTLITRVRDSGRKFNITVSSDGYVYYNDVYLRSKADPDASGNACANLTNCAQATDISVPDIYPVSNLVMNTSDGGATYTAKIHSTDVTYDVSARTVNWDGLSSPKTVNETGGEITFEFGIMICSITDNGSGKVVSCAADYYLVYSTDTSLKHKSTEDKIAYSTTDENLTAAWHSVTGASINGFYDDRRYIFVDTKAPTVELAGHGYSVFEYTTKCDISVDGTGTEVCKRSYDEAFITATDSATGNATHSISIGETTKSGLSTSGYGDVIMYTGAEYSKVTSVSSYTTSGLLENTSIIMNGQTSSSSYRDAANNNATTFNKFYVDIEVYLHIRKSGQADTYKKYIVVYDGSKYIYFVASSADSAGYVEGYDASTKQSNNATTIEGILEHIVSTAVEGAAHQGGDLTFSINYNVRDAANNVSAGIDNVTVRGVTYTMLASTIGVAAPAAVANVMSLVDDNTYVVNANQGVSLVTLLDGFEVSNVSNKGVNNMSSIKQSLYYNGEAIFENMPYTSDVLSVVDDYASAPGTYTLRLTSEREVLLNQGATQMISDKPLEISFVISPAKADVISDGDYSRVIATSITLIVGCMFMLGMGYISLKKSKKQ